MMLDDAMKVCTPLDIGVTVQTVPGNNYWDLGANGAPKQGGALYHYPSGMAMIFHITEAVDSAGAATVVARVIRSAVIGLTSPEVVSQSEIFAYTVLSLNRWFAIVIPEHRSILRYLGCDFSVAGATTTAGLVEAWLHPAHLVPSNLFHF